eukprot:augustus_masked-scaffold_129-processed-gene-0.1-mRNA-1 protein AED:1.00 eAED:1.00 QI:0/0/0/0/1/1/2/0/439
MEDEASDAVESDAEAEGEAINAEVEEFGNPGLKEIEAPTTAEGAAEDVSRTICMEAMVSDSPERDTVAGEANISSAEELKVAENGEAENHEAENDEELENEDEVENDVAAVDDEAEVIDLTQPAESTKVHNLVPTTEPRDYEAFSSDDALILDSATNLTRAVSKGRNKMVEAINLTSSSATKGKAALKAPRKKRMSKKQCEFYLKKPHWPAPKRFAIFEDDLRQAQKKRKANMTVEMLEKSILLSSNYPLLLMLVLSEAEVVKVPLTERVAHMLAATPNFRDSQEMSFGQLDPDRPRRNTPFRWVTKAKSAAGESMRAPKRKVRPSEHTKTEREKRVQERINTLTMANERINRIDSAANDCALILSFAIVSVLIRSCTLFSLSVLVCSDGLTFRFGALIDSPAADFALVTHLKGVLRLGRSGSSLADKLCFGVLPLYRP